MVVTSWLATARLTGLTLYVPHLARVEVETIRPDTTALLDILAGHPQIVMATLDSATAAAVARLLVTTQTWDATAGIIVHTARSRSWPVLAADPGRLQRIDPTIVIDPM